MSKLPYLVATWGWCRSWHPMITPQPFSWVRTVPHT